MYDVFNDKASLEFDVRKSLENIIHLVNWFYV
jgi:hypothetical protein